MFAKSRISKGLLASLLFVVLGLRSLLPSDAGAQVTIRKEAGATVIQSAGFQAQRVFRQNRTAAFSTTSSTGRPHWNLLDESGTSYEVENQTGRDDPDDPGTIIVGGYEDALDYLRTTYGAVITRDPVLGVDLITLPGQADPIGRFLEIIVTDTLNGHPLVDYFRLVEVISRGVFDQPVPEPATPIGQPLPFPNDPYLRNQWNLVATRALQAQWYTTGAKKRVRIGVIDSGIGTAARSHEGLDGSEITYVPVAPSTGMPLSHGLSLVTLLTDRGNDASGIIGLLGDRWNLSGCDRATPFFQQAPPEVRIYNVGDFGPISLYVARAIRQAIQDEVDVINLSLAMPQSPVVEDAIREALESNVVVVAAAGNYAEGATSRAAKFPANIEGVIAVGAADRTLHPTSFSALQGVDIFAPGAEIVTGGEEGIWVTKSGTSLAAPHVTAAVAMLRAARPELTPVQVQEALLAGARVTRNRVHFLNTFDALARMVPFTGLRSLIPQGCLADAVRPQLGLSMDAASNATLSVQADDVPVETALHPVFPNPFRTAATLRVDLAEDSNVRLALYDMLGREVRVLVDQELSAGTHEVQLDAGSLSAGQYLLRMKTPDKLLTQMVRLVR